MVLSVSPPTSPCSLKKHPIGSMFLGNSFFWILSVTAVVFDHGDNGHVTDSTGAQLSAADRKGVRETFLDVQDLSEAIRAVEQSESLGGDPGENTSCGLLVNINEEAAGGVLLGPGQETVFQTVGADFCRNSSSVAESSVSTELVKPRRFETFEVEQVELMLGMWSAVFFQEQNEDNTKHVKLSRRMTLGPADDPGAKIYPSCGDWCKGGYVLDDDHSEDGSFPHPAADADVKICIKEKKQWSTQSLACWNEAAGKKKLTNFSSREDAREQVFDVLLDEDVVFTKTIKLGPVTREKRLVGNHLLFLVAEDKQTCVVFFRSGEVKDPETTIEPHLGNSEVWAKLLALLSDLPAEATVIFGGHSEGSGWAHVAAHLYEKSLNHPVQGRGTGPLHVKVTTTAMLGFSKNYKRKIMGGEFSALNIVMGIQPRGNPEKVFWDMFTLHPNQQDETTQNNTEWINPKGVICDEDFTTCARGDDDLWHGGSSEAMKSQLGEYIDTIKPTAASKDSPLLTMKNMHDFSSYRRCLAKCLELGVL